MINLAPHSAENALEDEATTFDALGLTYTHIPADFKSPTDEDVARFVNSYKTHSDEKTWGHCAANRRVSTFLYRYRRDALALPDAEARTIIDTVWEPFAAWRTFLGETEE